MLWTEAPSFGRDGGHTLRIGDQVLWIFGDTFTPSGLLSSTAAWSRLSDPQNLIESIDGTGLPLQFLPYTSVEIEFNNDHVDVPDCCSLRAGCAADQPYCNCPANTDCAERIALWPGDGVATGDDSGRVYYEKFVIGAAPYDFRRVGVGLADVQAGARTAVRELDSDGSPRLIFGANDPGFARGLAVQEDLRRFYLYASVNRHQCAVDVLVGRVEATALTQRSSYEFWDGSGWQPALDRAAPILEQIPGGLGSVTWNTYLERYLSGWSDLCTGGRTFVLRTAARPEGPWSGPLTVDLGSVGASRDAYYGLLHPEFGSGRSLLLSFFQPVEDVYGQIRVARLRLD